MLTRTLGSWWFLMAFGLAFSSRPTRAQEDAKLEKEVLHLLVGEKGEHYIHGRPDYAGLLRIGEKALPIVLKHASDDEDSYRAAGIVVSYFSEERIYLPEAARKWVAEELKREKPSVSIIRAAGDAGMTEQIPRLIELAKSTDEKTACVAVQSLAALGTDETWRALEKLQTSCGDKEAASQCKALLADLFYPYQGSGGDAAILNAIATTEQKELKHAWGDWVRPYERLLRRIVYGSRKDLAPKLRDLANQIMVKDRESLNGRSPRLMCILVAIHRLGGDLSKEESELLEGVGLLEKAK